jgi:hypothetical protein
MNKTLRNFGVTIIVLGVVALAMGVVFLGQGFSKQGYLVGALKQEGITLGMLGVQGDKANDVIDSAKEAQLAGDTVREHRHTIAPSYQALLGGKHFDPTSAEQLTYAQALNLENYLYLAVASFGLVTVVLATGGFMIITGLALGATGIAMIRLAQGCLNMPAE